MFKQNRFAMNILEGFGSVLDLFPTPPQNPVSGSDAERLAQDWDHVGKDLKTALSKSIPDGNEID